jgi:hypothetical protein
MACTDCNDVDINTGPDGYNGWSPILALVKSTCSGDDVTVHRLISWTGGTGTRPEYLGDIMTDAFLLTTPIYLGNSGFVTNICSATNLKPADGTPGTPGSDASITVEEINGTPTGTPSIVKFGPNTITYSGTGNNTATYDPTGDWINIAYTGGDIINADSNPFYTSTRCNAIGSVIPLAAFQPYKGDGAVYTGYSSNASFRRLKYKINDDKTITIAGNLIATFSGTTTLNMVSNSTGGISGDVPEPVDHFFIRNCLLNFQFKNTSNVITPIAAFGTTVQQFKCTLVLYEGNGKNVVINSLKFIGIYEGLVNLYNSAIQVSGFERISGLTFASTYSLGIIIEHTFSQRIGA